MSLRGSLPVLQLDCRRHASESHVLAASYSISGKCSVTSSVYDHETLQWQQRYNFQSIFPLSAMQYAPQSVELGRPGALALTAGEAVAVWDQGLLVGFCAPEALESVGLPVPGRDTNKQPVWGVTAARWTDTRPHDILACHRSGSLGLYPVARLPGVGLQPQHTQSRAAGLFGKFTNLFTTPTTPYTQRQGNARATGPICQIFAHTHAPPEQTTTPNRRGSPRAKLATVQHFFTDAVLTAPTQVLAARHGDSALNVFDIREGHREGVQEWKHRGAASGNPKFVLNSRNEFEDVLMTMDKVKKEIHVFDLRNVSNNVLTPMQTYQIDDIFGHSVLVNDASICNSKLVLALQRDHAQNGGVENRLPSRRAETALACIDVADLCAGTTVSTSGMSNVSMLTDDNAATALASDGDSLFWSEVGVYMTDEALKVHETPYSGECLREARWIEASGTCIHMLPLR